MRGDQMIKRYLDKYSTAVLLFPYITLFIIFIVIPVVAAVGLSFTYFNTIEWPKFIGLDNYINLFTKDEVFMQKVVPNTIVYSIFVGIGGYLLSFFLAWSLSQISKLPRTILAIIIYSPSMTGGVLLTTVWSVIFNGDKSGYLNYILLKFNVIKEPVLWLQSDKYLLVIMIIVTLWSSMGVGFLAILAGILNINEELYEAAYIDGVKNRFQEIIYVTIPSAKPQMLFGAVMALVNTFQSSGIGVALSGANPTPNYAGQLIVTHIEDYGFIRYEMGYAAAISVVLLIIIRFSSVGAQKLFGNSDY
ncbi:ABC transporter permease [Clostridium thermosuccinogenes]|jgi:multiple sugar transport system permease protein|uniref:ABC transporter permease n=2 Tax=Clostridium thermosuccinogenes TaxID=84032 RepID=A0A2K2EVD1_9CLOT|nr:ABC transporter permease [Pseudoclostridium thermosuccinogenes]PNT90478.1 ABC transporter permease [Pseudoclostridium thermosuccinogenes]PNT98433.1 ABC transporter permease [Pseudoclostridium thermosuccinogenes]PNU00501.1 ABC transporter permease [Pseudoclostridium thermosuccinogenes]